MTGPTSRSGARGETPRFAGGLGDPDDADPGWIVYVDMDAYYVSCERRRRPDLASRPVIVGYPPGPRPGRSVVLSASYDARALGVRSAQPVEEAARRAPEAAWVAPDFPYYEATAEEIRERLRRFDPELIPRSIDEAALSLPPSTPEQIEATAREIQTTLRRELSLPSSLGAAPFEVVAKIASDRAKPGGIVVVGADRIQEFLAPLSVRVVPGIGPKAEAALRSHGWATLGDIARSRRSELRAALGPGAGFLLDLARGRPRPSGERSTRGGFRSADRTFDQDADEWEAIAPTLQELARSLGESLLSSRLRFSAVSVAFRWDDFHRTQRRRSLPVHADQSSTIALFAERLGRELWEERPSRRTVRTVSVRVEGLAPRRGIQRPLEHYLNGDRSPPSVM